MAITAEQLMVEVKADVRQAIDQLDRLERSSSRSMGRMGSLGKLAARTFGGMAIAGAVKKTVSLAMDFDATMRQVGIQTDQSGKKLQNLSKLAMKMGADTAYSAQDASQAMLELAKGGLKAADIRAGALQTTMKLAAAGGVDLASAAGYVTQGMNTFGLKAKQADQIVTALAGGANASTASVESLGMALSQVGPGATNAGMSIQETVAALAAFDNAGIKGADAGTSLKTMLANLVPATDEAKAAMKKYGLEFVKRNGDFKTMAQVSQELKKGLGGLSRAERVAAMRTIFGSDATRAATVLMKEGSKGIQGYIRATKDRTKAQKMADSAMQGASGAWQQFTGSVETAAIQLGTKLLPGFTKAANAGADFINEAMTWGPQVEESLGWTVDMGKKLVGPLKELLAVGKDVGSFLGGLPGPVKEIGVQVALASFAFPKLAAGLTSVTTRFTTAATSARAFATSLTTAQGRTAALGKAMSGLKTGAGIAGMVALTQGAEHAGTAMGGLATAAGGALLGFSVGGPWGAAIGGGIGALKGLADANHAAWDSFKSSIKVNEDYAASLDQVTGKIIEATRQTAFRNLSNDESLTVSRMLGIPDRDMVSAAIGDMKALKRVQADVRKGLKAGFFNKESAADFINGLKYEGRLLDEDQKKLLERIEATKKWGQALKGVPKSVKTKLEQMGYRANLTQIERLVDRYKLTPKQVKTMVSALGVDVTDKQLRTLIDRTKDLGRQHPTPRADLKDNVTGPVARAKGALQDLDGNTATTFVDIVTRRYNSGIPNGIAAPTTTPKKHRATGGPVFGPGTGTSDSIPAMLSNGEWVIPAKAVNMLGAARMRAIQAGKLPAFAKGGHVGKTKKERLEDARGVIREMVSGLRGTVADIRKTFGSLEKTIQANMSGKELAKWTKRLGRNEHTLTRKRTHLADLETKLGSWRETLASRRGVKADFMGSVREGISSQATVLNAGDNAGTISSSLATQAKKAVDFAGMLQTMRKMGYSGAIVRQVAAAGVEGGWQAATALVKASKAQVGNISRDFKTITDTADSTAKQLGGQMYDAGIHAAEGMVEGLRKRRKAVEETIRTIALGMQKALRAALGIHSPSRVMAKLASYAPAGIVKGLLGGKRDVTKASAALAWAVQKPHTTGSTKGLTPAALQGGVRAGASVAFHFTTHNPQAEPQSRTVNKALAKVATLGLV